MLNETTNTQQAKALTIPFQQIDWSSALALAQSKDVLDDLFYDFCGLSRYKQGDNTFLMRVSKPIFTPKYANNLVKFLGISINRITARTKFSPSKIEKYMIVICCTLREELACNGFNNLVSDQVWEKILAYKKSDVWNKKYRIDWTENKNITDSMIGIIKKKEKLKNESFGQDFLLRNIFNQLVIFIEGSLNRSVNALTLEHEKIIHKESIITNNRPDLVSDEGKLNKVQRGIKDFLGWRS